MNEQTKVMYDSPEAAQYKTVTGWVSRLGFFWGDNEHAARYQGCTHRLCKCGTAMSREYTMCPNCRTTKQLEQYPAMPFQEWDGKTPLTLYNDDTFFWSEEDVWDYCELHNVKPEDLRLVICEPEYGREIDPNDFFSDDLPDGCELKSIHPELAAAIENVNAIIRKKAVVISWYAGRFRTKIVAEGQ